MNELTIQVNNAQETAVYVAEDPFRRPETSDWIELYEASLSCPALLQTGSLDIDIRELLASFKSLER
jgi:hypothetical protein